MISIMASESLNSYQSPFLLSNINKVRVRDEKITFFLRMSFPRRIFGLQLHLHRVMVTDAQGLKKLNDNTYGVL